VNTFNHILKHKLTQFLLILVFTFLFFQFGIPLLSQALTGKAAPISAHLLWTIYMPLILMVLLLYVSSNETAWEEFKAPLRMLILERERRLIVVLRMILLVALPLLAGWVAYRQVQPQIKPPAELRSIHPAPPGSITVDGEIVNLRNTNNPFRDAQGNPDAQALAAGKEIYAEYCVYCHGDALDGNGLFASALRPSPADFTDPGTIASLEEAFLFWRIAQGGPGMPPEGKGWNSAMPAWEGKLKRDEIWQVILYLYDATGQHPLTVGE